MNETPQSGQGSPIGPRPTMPSATNVPPDRTGASAPTALPHTAPPVHRASSHRWWWLVAAGALLLLVAGGGFSGWGGGGPFTSSTSQQHTYRGNVTSLDLTGGSGDVQVTGGAPAGTVEVTRHLRWGMGGQPSPNEQLNGGTLAIDSRCGGGFMSMCSIDYEVKVPDATAVTLGVGSGDIALSGTLGVVTAETGSGDVNANGLAAGDTTLRTGSGDVDLSFNAAPSKVDLRTGSGNVDLFVPKGESYAVDVTTGSGDKNVSVDTSQSSPRSIQIQTGSGDVDVAYR